VIAGYLAQDISHKPKTGVDGYGQPAFGTPAHTKGRWLEKNRLVRNAQGEQKTSEITVTLLAGCPAVVGDQLSLDGTTWHTIIALSASRGLNGEVMQKRAYL
jgi:hypothetical protein